VIVKYSQGHRTSNPLSLNSIKKVKSSNIKWTSTEPTDTDLKIYTAISDSNTVGPSGKVDVLVVAGGGGGGAAFENSSRMGGGGGGGGLIYEENYDVWGYPITIIVGAGGEGSDDRHSDPHRVPGDDGENSSFGSLEAIGGGGGSSSSSEDDGRPPAGDGGSGGGGGGGAFSQGSGGTGILGQGHDGADGTSSYSGGGGGAVSAGSEITGGSGYSFLGNIYAEGGAGTDSTTQNHGLDAGSNTGDGGGGGSGDTDNFGYGGDGGSGIVLVRYKTGTITATGGTITTSGDYTIHAFTADGTFSPTIDYQEATNDSTIPDISVDDDLTGKYLWVRQELSTNTDTSPELTSLEVEIIGGRRLKRYDGSDWIEKSTMVYNGSNWEEKFWKSYDGEWK